MGGGYTGRPSKDQSEPPLLTSSALSGLTRDVSVLEEEGCAGVGGLRVAEALHRVVPEQMSSRLLRPTAPKGCKRLDPRCGCFSFEELFKSSPFELRYYLNIQFGRDNKI